MLEIVALLAVILFAGYVAERVFAKTRIPDIFILLLLGLFLGPAGGIHLIPALQTVSPLALTSLAGLVAVLTLVVILFDAGTGMNVSDLLKQAPFAFTGTIVNFLVTTAACFLALFIAGWNWVHALLVAVLIADTAEEVVFPLIERLTLRPWVRTLLVFEGAFTSTLIGIGTVLVLGVLTAQQTSLQQLGNFFLGSLSIALFVGALVSWLWIHLLLSNQVSTHRYLLSLAVAMGLYAFVEVLQANGVIAVLVFGIALGMVKEKLEASLFEFHKEITFLVRSFFFVYLGYIISFERLTFSLVGVSLLASGAMVAGRLVGLQYIAKTQNPTKAEFVLLAGALPAGLATAVFATVLQRYGVVIPNLSEFIFLVIFETILFSVACTYYYANNQPVEQKRPVVVRSS